jgi:hypothetical protein
MFTNILSTFFKSRNTTRELTNANHVSQKLPRCTCCRRNCWRRIIKVVVITLIPNSVNMSLTADVLDKDHTDSSSHNYDIKVVKMNTNLNVLVLQLQHQLLLHVLGLHCNQKYLNEVNQ